MEIGSEMMSHRRQWRGGTLEHRVRPITTLPAIALVMSSILVATGPSALAAAGDLDTTFGSGGLVTIDTDPHFGGYAYAIAVQPDGKIVAAGFAGSSFGLTRINPDGSLDTSFGSDGTVTTDFGGGSDSVSALAIQADGKIVAVGTQGSRGVRFAIARYGTDGALDTTFSGNGKATTDFSPRRLDGATDVALQADGKILVAGVAGVSPDGPGPGGKFALVRYNPDGTLDTDFSDDGKATTDFTPRADAVGQVAIQTDGTIVAAGAARGAREIALARYKPDGSLDATFSGDGKAVAPFTPGGSIYTVAIQAEGEIVAAGSTDDESAFALARYNTDGTVDTTFGEDGGTTTDVTTGHDGVSGVAMQADGKIVAAGDGTSSVFALARYRPDGALDMTFSGDGTTTTDFSPYYDVAYTVAIQGDGKIVAAGAANGSVFALARYLAT